MTKVMKKIFLALIVAFLSLGITGCSKTIVKDDTEFVIVTTLYPTYEFVNCIIEGQQNIGNNIKVELIVPYGTDSHNYDPSLSDYLAISNADLFIYTSDEMEPWAKGLGLDKNKVLNIYDAMIEKYDDFEELQILQSEDLVNHEHTHDDNHNHTGDSHQHNSYKEGNNFFEKKQIYCAIPQRKKPKHCDIPRISSLSKHNQRTSHCQLQGNCSGHFFV